MLRRVLVLTVFFCFLFVTPSHAESNEPITVVAWNVELNDASPVVLSSQLAEFDGVDIWGLSEVNRTDAVPFLEAGVEDGENADFDYLISESGGGDKQVNSLRRRSI